MQKELKDQIRIQREWLKQEQLPTILYVVKWLVIASIIGIFAGSLSALFLYSLDWVTEWRENHKWIIWLLPLGGLLIGLMYHYLGRDVEKGNNLLLEEIHNPTKIVNFKMAPLILISTLTTHFFGGSAGREGTAVQMGGAIADQLNHLIKFKPTDRILILICGISAGFASVFGTPIAGAIFGLEVYIIGRLRYNAIFPAFIAALVGDYVCDLWHIKHVEYHISYFPEIDGFNIFYCMLAGIAFGLTALFFSKLTHTISSFYRNKIGYAPLRPAIGGIVITLGVWAIGSTKFIGLGIPTIIDSFNIHLPVYYFFLKILFTALTLGAFFKGGEVTPLFFIGAALGNALSLMIPLPMDLLAGMGFVAVFAAAANTPIAGTIVAIELFGMKAGIFAGLATIVAYLFSGHTGIYSSQILGEVKNEALGEEEGKMLTIIEVDRKSKRGKDYL